MHQLLRWNRVLQRWGDYFSPHASFTIKCCFGNENEILGLRGHQNPTFFLDTLARVNISNIGCESLAVQDKNWEVAPMEILISMFCRFHNIPVVETASQRWSQRNCVLFSLISVSLCSAGLVTRIEVVVGTLGLELEFLPGTRRMRVAADVSKLICSYSHSLLTF